MALLNTVPYFLDSDSNSELANYLVSKKYVPKENALPKVSLIKNVETDVIYLLSKLSDDDLLKLLNEQPSKNEYDLNDIIRLADKSKTIEKYGANIEQNLPPNSLYNVQKKYKKRFQKKPEKTPVFRLEFKEVVPFNTKQDADPRYIAVQKLKNLLYSRPQNHASDEEGVADEDKKELLFDILVNQLKSLCCKSKKMIINQDVKKTHIKSLLSDLITQNLNEKTERFHNKYQQSTVHMNNEYMFLIINDEIKSNGSDELVFVDPESIENNSSVLLLGPISSPLSDTQLKLVMGRISNELSKPEYLPLLQQLSEGVLNDNNKRLINSVVSGPDTRRYIKPHRCNYQSKLARVYGGPRWIICTGYLNLNTPSLYDK